VKKRSNDASGRQMVLKAAVLFIALLNPVCSFCQVNLRLAPVVGIQTLSCYVKDRTNADSRFRTDNFSTTPSFGISLQVDIKNNWMFFAGWSTCNLKISYRYGESGTNQARRLTFPANRFQIGLQKTITTNRWFKIPANNRVLNSVAGNQSTLNKYLFLFRSRMMAGISYDLVDSFPGNVPDTQRVNGSVFLGLCFQFFDYDKDRLQVNVFYSQGFEEIGQRQVDYFINNKPYSGIIGSKGSFFTIQLSYPMQLASI
jgi:hypothetical protein